MPAPRIVTSIAKPLPSRLPAMVGHQIWQGAVADQSAELDWRGTVPVSTQFDDPYYSLEDGAAEAAHVFLGGNDLPARLRDGFHIAELGFGTGVNLLVALSAFRTAGCEGVLHFTSFEAFPMTPEDMARAQAAFPTLQPLAREVMDAWEDGGVALADLRFEMITGDARDTLPRWAGHADAWFLDGFSPAKNPELWGEALMAEVGAHTAPGGTCATYTAAGHVRRALDAAGFEITRVQGFGRKRHMTRGVLR